MTGEYKMILSGERKPLALQSVCSIYIQTMAHMLENSSGKSAFIFVVTYDRNAYIAEDEFFVRCALPMLQTFDSLTTAGTNSGAK